MLGHRMLRFTSLLTVMVSAIELWAGPPVRGRSQGDLAIKAAADGEWRIHQVGDLLPASGEARTSANGTAHLQSEQGTLSLHSLAGIRYDLTAQGVELLHGRLFCQANGDRNWTIQAAGLQVTIPAGSGVEIRSGSDGVVTVTALRGTAQVSASKLSEVSVAARTVLSMRPSDSAGPARALDAVSEQQLLAWSTPLPLGQGVGQIMIKDAQGDAATRLNIARYHAEVILQPPVALVKLDQAFYNPSPRQEEGEFIFNLPPGASVSRFAMYVTRDTLIEGEVIERGRADEVYTTIVRGRRDPAILEQIGDNLFKMRVFPIFPNDVKRILLDFTIPLDGQAGQHRFTLPLMSDLQPIWDFRLFGTIRGATPMESVQSPTMPDVKFFSRGPQEIGFDFARQEYQPTSNLVLAFQQQLPARPQTYRRLDAAPLNLTEDTSRNISQFAHLDSGGTIRRGLDDWNSRTATYFLAELPVPPAAPQAVAPADVVLLVDTSANGTLQQVAPSLRTVLASLRNQDRFRLVCVDVVARPLGAGWSSPRTREAVEVARQFERQICLGATDMLAACEAVAGLFDPSSAGRRRVVIYIGDGLDSVHRQQPHNLPQECAGVIQQAGASLFAINTLRPPGPPGLPRSELFRTAVQEANLRRTASARETGRNQANQSDGRLFLRRLATATGGRSYDIAVDAADRGQLFGWLLSGLPQTMQVVDLQVNGALPHDVYYDSNVLSGESLRVAGRIKSAAAIELKYTLRTGGQPDETRTVKLQPDAEGSDYLVGRYWADQRLQHLSRILSANSATQGDPAARALIVQLSREWSILTPQTAYLVLETEADYASWGVPRQARRPYWSGKELPPTEPLPATWVTDATTRRQAPQVKENKPTNESLIESQLKLARQSLAEKQADVALRHLDVLRGDRRVERSRDYLALRSQAEQLVWDSRAIRGLGIKQGWVDPLHLRNSLPIDLNNLFSGVAPVSEYLLDRHPLAEVLLQEIDLPNKPQSIADFAAYLKKTLGIHVVVDQLRLEEVALDSKTLLPVRSLKRISALQAIRWQLDAVNLAFYEEPRRLTITTQDEARIKRRRVLFPVQDLVSNRPRFLFEDLHDPIADRNAAVQRRIEAKLDRLTTWKFKAESLQGALDRLTVELGENVVLNHLKLEEESIAPDATDIDIDCENLPLRDVLKEFLREKNLTYSVEREALLITTLTDSYGAGRPLKLYPVSGLVFRDTRPAATPPAVPRVNRPFGRGFPTGGGFGGGFSGALGGGFGGGGMGGIAFFPVGPPSQAEFGDGLDGASSIWNSADLIDDTELPSSIPIRKPRRPTTVTPPLAVPDDLPDSLDGQSATAGDTLIETIEMQTGGPPDSPWLNADGEGGAGVFLAPSMVLAISQTDRTHAEIAELLKAQRDMLAKRGRHPDLVPVTPWEVISEQDTEVHATALKNAIMLLIGGQPDSPWKEPDGEGGSIAYDKPRYALSIVQTSHTLDEINSFLVNLRRERYALLHQSRPWSDDLLPASQLGLISGPWLATATPVAEPQGLATAKELEALQSRAEFSAGKWQWLESPRPPRPELTLRTAGERLQLSWPGWEIRAVGNEASITVTDLQYAEGGAWGQALREWLDVELIFWPHRSNRELARMFDVSVVTEAPARAQPATDQQQIRIRFVPNGFVARQLSLDVVYDKATRLPMLCEVLRLGSVAQRYRMTAELDPEKVLTRLIVQQESVTGEIFSRGEWTSVPENAMPLPAPDEVPAGTILLDRRPLLRATVSGLERGLQYLRQNQFRAAADEFRKAVDVHRQHPLVRFLLAWSLDNVVDKRATDDLPQAYARSLEVAPLGIVRFLAQQGSRQLSRRDLYELVSPKLQGSGLAQDQLSLARISLQDSNPVQALQHATAAAKLSGNADAQRFEVLQVLVEALLRTGNVPGALQQFQVWSNERPRPWNQISELLGVFEYFEAGPMLKPQYSTLLERPDLLPIPEVRRSLLARYADVMEGAERWEKLLEAAELLPADSKQGAGELSLILTEIESARDLDSVLQLLKRVKYPAHRQQLLALQAQLTADPQLAQDINWQLHQAGFQFNERLTAICDLFNATQHPERTIEVLEAVARTDRLSHSERMGLAAAYEAQNRNLDARRARSGLE